jgi:parallel beta-helix repeat protein
LISGCMSRKNGSYGIYANDCVVRDCQAENNSNSGIGATYSTVRDCHVRNNALHGIYAAVSTVSGCYVSKNARDGIVVNGDDCQIIGNNCSSNNISGNVNDAGILIYHNNNRVEDNHVTANGNSGIWVFNGGYSNNIIVRNTVIGTNNYNIPTGQISGPLITNTVSGVITNSNPWANFSF